MQVLSIKPTDRPRWQRRRYAMSVRWDKHTIVDLQTGVRATLPAVKAWELYEALNMEV